uniref:Putative muscle m-line assembly protein unc-89 n=1 Tax=Hyalomma excavatum TaxID=257692 RepID=A0A131X946_9ACAR
MPSDGSSAGSGIRRVRSPEAGSGNRVVTRRFISSPAPLADTDVISNTKREEWTTSKKVVNHKTRQTETRVQRQLVLEDGKVIADTGPQITTRTTEDNKVEESEDTQHKKTGDEDVPDGYVPVPGSERVVCEKTESHQVTKETKEENMKMHDENFKELRGPEEIHRLAVMVPDESPLVGIRPDRFPGKLTHYSSRSRKVTDKDEVKEISEERNGEVTKQTTRTHHHEEKDDDEVPEDEAEGKDLPAVERETKRNFEYLHDGADIKVPDRMRKQKDLLYLQATSPERHDPVTRRALSLEEEEEIRNSETNRWLDNHFGSETSDDDVVKSKHGGNVINVKMTDTKRTPTPPTKPPRESPNLIYTTPYFKSPTPSPTPLDSTLRSTKSQQKTTSYRREEKIDDSRQSRSSPRSNWKSSPSIYHDVTRHLDESPTRYTKEDRSYRDLESSYRPVEKSTIVGNSVFTREDRRLNESRRVTSEYDRDVKKQQPPERARSPESRPVQRSQSTRTPEKPVAQPPTYTYSLPRGQSSRRATRVDQASKTSRGVQADLDDEPYTPPSSRYVVHTVRETQSLPRHHHHHHRHHHHHTSSSHHRHRSEETEHRRSGDRNRSPESNISTASRPSKTFYFGDKTDTSYHNSRHKDGYFTIEKDRYVQPPRRFRSDPRERYYSVEDLTTRSYATTAPTSSAKKPGFIDRQRYFPATPPASPPPRLIKITNGRSTSPSPPESPRPTSTSHLLPPPSPYASLNRRYRSPSPVVNPPAFTPLQSPVEVKRQQSTSSYSRSYHHRSATADSTGSKPGPSVIEVRNWDSR